MKRIFLASEAKHPGTFKDIEKFVEGFKGRKVAYIPTAANGEEIYGVWQKGETWNLFKNSGAVVEPLVLEEYKSGDVVNYLKSKDIVFVAGGMSGYLAYWLRRFELEKHLVKLIDDGLIYIGSSAGSMVCARTSEIAEHYLDDPEKGAGVIPGLGLVDFDIYPHYEDAMLTEIKKSWKGGDLYLLKNGESVIIEDNQLYVIGEKRLLRDGKLLR